MNFEERRARQVSLGALSSIEVKFYLADCRSVSYETILVVEFVGDYRMGCSGAPDATFMVAMTEAGLAAWEPGAVVLDLRELGYQWGDNLEGLFSVGWRLERLALACVVGPRCEEAVRTLVLGIDSEDSIEAVEWIFRDLEGAAVYVDKLLAERKEAIQAEAALRKLNAAEKLDPNA